MSFLQISLFGSGPIFVVASSTFGGFGDSLALGGMMIGSIRIPKSITMPFWGC